MCSRARDQSLFKNFGRDHANAPIVHTFAHKHAFLLSCRLHGVRQGTAMGFCCSPKVDKNALYRRRTAQHIYVGVQLSVWAGQYSPANDLIDEGCSY